MQLPPFLIERMFAKHEFTPVWDASIAKGELAVLTGDLSRLIGGPTAPIADSIAEALKALEG